MAQPRKRDYSAENARRNELARQAGFTSYRQQRDARAKAAGRARDYRLERERERIRAVAQGFDIPGRSPVELRREFNRRKRANPKLAKEQFLAKKEAVGKTAVLKKFGITEREFLAIRKENLRFHDEWLQTQVATGAINTYDELLDSELNNWSERRVGYIISFHSAVVDPRTNYDSIPKRWVKKLYKGRDGKWKGGFVRITSKSGKIITNENQFYYLVKYSNLMSIDEYESRYGMTAVQRAQRMRLADLAP